MQRPCAPKARRPTFGPLCIHPTILPFLCSCPFLVSIFTVGLCVLWVLCGPSKATARCYTSICDGIIRYIFVIILMHLVLKFWLWGRFVAEKQSYLLNLMAGHLLNMTYDENSKWNVWELDHYTDRSSLGIHYRDLYWKMVHLKFEKCWY